MRFSCFVHFCVNMRVMTKTQAQQVQRTQTTSLDIVAMTVDSYLLVRAEYVRQRNEVAIKLGIISPPLPVIC